MEKKLLCIASHFSTGGMPQVLVKRVESIKDDLDIYVVEYNNYSNDFIIQKNRIKKLLKPDHYFTLGDNKKEILSIIDKIHPDYIHFEEIPELFNIDFDIAQKIYNPDRYYKIFETTHSSDFNVDGKIFFPDKFLFVSQYNCFKFNKFGIPTEVIEYPVEKKVRNPIIKEESMKKLGLDPNYKHVVNVGLFTPRKNQAYAFEIARQLQNDKILFHFIGNQADNFQDYWRPLMKIKPKNCIIWNERDDVDVFLDACDLFLFTSMGFRWNKELNPLVIKEALEHQIPQFIFPLDVYNRKYDIEDTINYLNGNVDIDSAYIKNFLYKREIKNDKKYKIRAVHLLLEEDDRKSESIKELERLKEFGIDYVQHINKRYIDDPPKEFCARPHDVGRIGAYSLRGPHYGNYLSFKKAILTEFTDNVDFLLVFESDCKLNVPIEEFVQKVYDSCDPIIQRGIYYMSFGDNRNLRTGEIVSDNHGQINDWMYMTNKIIGIQSIMFPKFAYNFIKNAYDTTLWDVSDLMFNDMFKNKGKAIAPRLTTQIEGVSTIQGENITHFLLKTESDLFKYKDPNDIIVEFNKNDEKFHFCVSDFYQGDVGNITIHVHSDIVKNIYKVENTMLSPYSPIWIMIYEYQKHNEFTFDFYYKDEYLFTKKLSMSSKKVENINKNIENEIVHKKVEEKLIQLKSEEKIINLNENDFNLDFHIDENKLYLPYIGMNKDVRMKVVVKNIDTNDVLFSSQEMTFNNNSYCNWISFGRNYYKDDNDFNGFEVNYLQNEKILFKRELRLRHKIIESIELENIKIENVNVDNIENRVDDKKIIYSILTYPNTSIKNDITKKCIEQINKSGKKTILSSHYPVSKELQSKVDYYLYDSYNPLINHTLYNFYWSYVPEGKVELRLDKLNKSDKLNQSLTVLNNIDNSVKFSKMLGYKYVICVNYDFIFNDSNIELINNICDKLEKSGKLGYFMKFKEGDMDLYKSVFFIIDSQFYDSIFNSLRTPEEFNIECQKLGSHNFLESYFYKKLVKHKDKLIIEETDENKLFNNNEINIFSGVEYLSIVPVKDKMYDFIIWYNSSNTKDDRRIDFVFENNGKTDISAHYVKQKSYYMKKISLNVGDNYIIKVNFIDSNTNNIIEQQVFNINKDNYYKIIENGLFTEN